MQSLDKYHCDIGFKRETLCSQICYDEYIKFAEMTFIDMMMLYLHNYTDLVFKML